MSEITEELSMPTLAPCPFCGGNGKWSPKFYATIITCDACGADGPPCDDIAEAAGAWNRRVGDQS